MNTLQVLSSSVLVSELLNGLFSVALFWWLYQGIWKVHIEDFSVVNSINVYMIDKAVLWVLSYDPHCLNKIPGWLDHFFDLRSKCNALIDNNSPVLNFWDGAHQSSSEIDMIFVNCDSVFSLSMIKTSFVELFLITLPIWDSRQFWNNVFTSGDLAFADLHSWLSST